MKVLMEKILGSSRVSWMEVGENECVIYNILNTVKSQVLETETPKNLSFKILKVLIKF